MKPLRLVKRDLLDPRPEGTAVRQPIEGAVNIPFSELPDRLHELPARSVCLQVVGPPDIASTVVQWLEQHGRTATIAAARPDGTVNASESASASERVSAPGSISASAANEIGRLWEPSALLEETAAQLRPGSALDLACGSGRNPVFLAGCGWEATAIDILPDALARGRELERRYAKGWTPISWVCADLRAGETAKRTGETLVAHQPVPPPSDWPGPGRRFDLITIFRYLDRALLSRLGDWLEPGASVVVETFTTLHRERHGRPKRAAHVLKPGELKELLQPLASRMLLRHYSEAWRGDEHTARLWLSAAPGCG
jgi:tellurite methyltransferase